MEEDGPTSSTQPTVVEYEEEIIFGSEKFQVVDSGVVPSTSRDSDSSGKYYQRNQSWPKKMKSARFRASFPHQGEKQFSKEKLINNQKFIEETSRAVSSVNEEIVEEEIDEPRQYPEMECQPSTSKNKTLWLGLHPLKRMGLQIGKNVLRLKVVNALTPSLNEAADSAGRFRCSLCKLMFRTQEEHQKHIKNFHTAVKDYICVICGLGFTNKASLTMHHRIHNGPKKNTCNICHKSFTRAANLVQHVKFHQSGRHHFCEMCGRCFKDMDQMMEHQTTCVSLMNGEYVQLDKPLRYQCNFCERMFHHKRDKFIHERVHTGERPYECGYCGRSFTQSQALTIHIRLHTGERPFSCSYCSKPFKDSSSLRKHEFKFHTQVGFMDYEEEEEEIVPKISTGIVEEEDDDEYHEEMWK